MSSYRLSQLGRRVFAGLRQCQRNSSFTAVATVHSPHADCPLECVDDHYVLKDQTWVMPKIDSLSYLDDLRFRNYHSKIEVLYTSNFEKSARINSIPDPQLIAIWVPGILQEIKSPDWVVAECQEWFRKWARYGKAKELYTPQRIQFAFRLARLCAGFWHEHTAGIRHVAFTMTMVTFWIDDVCEKLIQQSDPNLYQAWRLNLDRIVDGREQEVKRIDLTSLTNFPPEELARAEFCEEVLSELVDRIKKHTSPSRTALFQAGYHYYMDHVALEGDIRFSPDHVTDPEAGARFLEARSAISAVTMTTPQFYTDYCAKLMTVQDPCLTLAEIAVTCGGDMMSFFKENFRGQKIGNVPTNASTINWHMQVDKKSVGQAFATNATMHNNVMMALQRMYEVLNPRDRPRCLTAMKNAVTLGDYHVVCGFNQLNPRYGWYPVKVDPDNESSSPE